MSKEELRIEIDKLRLLIATCDYGDPKIDSYTRALIVCYQLYVQQDEKAAA